MDKTEAFKKEIKPIIDELTKVCNLNRVPMFVTCAIADDGSKTTYMAKMISAAGNDIDLSQDYFANFANVLNGFTTIDQEPDLVLGKDREAIYEFMGEQVKPED